MKRFLVLLLAVMLCLTASGMAEVALEGLPITDEPITLTCAVQQSPIQGDFNEMVILKEFAEESNVNIEFQNIPSSDLETQLSLMLASAEVPDLLMKMNVSAATQATYAAEGMFVALSDYEEYMPNLMSWFEEYPTAKDAVTMSDGKIYGAPYILAGESIRMGGKMWFNTDLMEKVGYDTIPTTTDELLEYFRATAAYDYNENGQADEIALSAGSIDDVMYLFMGSYGLMNRGSSHRDVYVDDDGELQYAYSSERFKEELRYLNQMYTEGLLDPDIFTIDFAQLIAKSSTGRVGTYIFVNNSPVSNTEYEQYTLGFTEPFEGPQGYKTYGYYSIPASSNAQFMITYRCAEKGEDAVKAAVRWMDYWYSEEGIIRYFMGVEGVTYEEDADSPGGLKLTDYVLSNPDGISFEEVLAEYVPWAGGANPSVATNEYFKGGETWPVCLAAAEGLINYVPEIVWPPFSSVYSAEDATEMASIKTEQENYMKEWRAYFITGQRDIDADWDEYVAGYDGMNTTRYMELYRAAREAMGVE